jgi:hypothetical protein
MATHAIDVYVCTVATHANGKKASTAELFFQLRRMGDAEAVLPKTCPYYTYLNKWNEQIECSDNNNKNRKTFKPFSHFWVLKN